jgi:hypothetical protein
MERLIIVIVAPAAGERLLVIGREQRRAHRLAHEASFECRGCR